MKGLRNYILQKKKGSRGSIRLQKGKKPGFAAKRSPEVCGGGTMKSGGEKESQNNTINLLEYLMGVNPGGGEHRRGPPRLTKWTPKKGRPYNPSRPKTFRREPVRRDPKVLLLHPNHTVGENEFGN